MRTLALFALACFAVASQPSIAGAQAPVTDDVYTNMPPPSGGPGGAVQPGQPNPYGQPNAYGQPEPYGQQPNPYGQQPNPYGQQPNPYGESWQPGETPQDPNGPPSEVGYDDAGAEAWAQEIAETDSSYVDDGYDVDAWMEYEATLSPYGSWVNTADYGRVWYPSSSYVGGDFMPYSTGGHWVLTEYGWTWVSDWDWGWAPFHYGRWLTIGAYGWCWIPGRVWGPAWVSWRWGGGYAGWAPLPPRGVRIAPPPPAGGHGGWRFVSAGQLGASRVTYLSAGHARTIFGVTSPMRNVQRINRYRVEAGPHPQLVSTSLGRAMQPTAVHRIPVAAPRATIIPRSPPSAFAPQAAPGYRGTPIYHRPLAAQPGYRAPPPMPPPVYSPPAAAASQPAWRAQSPNPAPAWRGGPAAAAPAPGPGFAAPVPRAAPAPTYNAPAFRPAPAPVYNAPTFHAAPPAFRPSAPAPMYNSAPAFRPSPAPSYSAPAFRPSPAPSYSAPAFRPSPAPSAPSFHAPAPAPMRPSFSAPSPAARPGAHFGGRR